MHITSGVNIYLYMRVSLLVPKCPLCVCVYYIKSKYHSQQDGVVIKVQRRGKFRSIVSLCKITH